MALVSLKRYSKSFILEEMKHRFEKIASLLDDADYEDQFVQTMTWLDQAICTPRVVLIKSDEVVNYNGGNFVDVSQLHIDVINNVYYEDKCAQTFNTILPELGLLPFLTSGNRLTQLGDITSYLQLKTNLNMMNRQLEFDGDYELFPIDENGCQMLQLRNKGMTKIEFLPSLLSDLEEWNLYEYEYSFFKDMFFAKCNLLNAEMQLSAQGLGIGKEASNLTAYWEKKIENIKNEFQEHVMITYMG